MRIKTVSFVSSPRLYLAALLSLILFTLAPHCSAAEPAISEAKLRAAEKHYQLGLAYLKQGRRSSARLEFTVALRINPSHEGAAQELRNGFPASPDALKALNQKETGREEEEVSYQKGLKSYRASQLAEAREEWKRLLQKHPDSAQAKEALGWLDEENFLEDANQPFNSLVKSNFEDGMKFYRSEHYDQAIEKFDEALQMGPRQPQVTLFRKRSQEKLDKAKQEEALQGHLEHARAAQKAGDFQSAASEWAEVLKIAPDSDEAKKAAAETADMLDKAKVAKTADLLIAAAQEEKKSEWQKAKDLYVQALSLDPENRDGKEGLGRVGKNLKAGAEQEKITELLKQAARAMEDARYKEAKKTYLKVLDIQEDQPEALEGMKKVEASLEKKGKDREKGVNHYVQGKQLMMMGKMDEAIKEFEFVPPEDSHYDNARRNIKNIKREQQGKETTGAEGAGDVAAGQGDKSR